MIGPPGHYIAFHDHSTKIFTALGAYNAVPVGCAISCSVNLSSGDPVREHAENFVRGHRFRTDTPIMRVHEEFESKYRAINNSRVGRYQINSLVAKFEGSIACLSYGTLAERVQVSREFGMMSYTPIGVDDSRLSRSPTKQEAIDFIHEVLTAASQKNVCIGKDLDIVCLTASQIEWIEGFDRISFPVHKEELLRQYISQPSEFRMTEFGTAKKLRRFLSGDPSSD